MFEAADDQAGTGFQCPKCGRLVDVPTLSELPSISQDGTYKLDHDPEARTPEEQLKQVAELQRVYTRNRTDEYGREIDLRPTLDDVKEAGTDEIPLELADEVRPAAPRYDPITGELIRPLEVKDDAPQTSGKGIWTGAPVPHYASDERLPFQSWQIIPHLFHLQNVAVMFGVLLMHLLFHLMLFPLSMRFLILAPFMLVVVCAFFSHYANIIEAIGPDGADELPRPLRDLQLMEDLWGPFSRFMLALLIAYGVSITYIYLPEKAQIPFLMMAYLIGSFAFPALLLTATTSGSVTNLRPDRVLGVIKAIGAKYILLVGAWIVMSLAYLVVFVGSGLSFLHIFDRDHLFFYDWYLSPLIAYPALCGVIVLMHALMWYLGLQYRFHHAEFPWVLQSHVRKSGAPPKRGFEVERQRQQKRRPVPVAAQPVLPVEVEVPMDETAAQAQARRQRLLDQARDAERGKVRAALPVRPPPDDHFDVDELLKP
jgi:hypothetical protein